MESKNELKAIGIKNHTCYYLNDIIITEDFDIDNILIDGKSHENAFVYNILYNSSIDSKLLRYRFHKIDKFTRTYYGIKYLVLFGSEKHDSIYNRIDIS